MITKYSGQEDQDLSP